MADVHVWVKLGDRPPTKVRLPPYDSYVDDLIKAALRELKLDLTDPTKVNVRIMADGDPVSRAEKVEEVLKCGGGDDDHPLVLELLEDEVSEGSTVTVTAQAESNGNEEEDYYKVYRDLYQHNYLATHTEVDSRTTLKHSLKCMEEGKLDGLPPSAKSAGDEREVPSGSPYDRFYESPKKEELEVYEHEVKHELEKARDAFPTAHGLVVGFSNEVGCEESIRVPQIHESSRVVCQKFSQLGYAYCIFQESRKAKILAVYNVLATMKFPSSYGALFIYFTGHGHKYHISTMDGYISINTLKQLLSAKNAPCLINIAKILIFDCCRESTILRDSNQTTSEKNLIMFYMTPLDCPSFLVNDVGMSVATIELVKLLERRESCPLTEVFVQLNRMVEEAIKKIDPSICMRPDFVGSLSKSIDLYKDKRRASKILSRGSIRE